MTIRPAPARPATIRRPALKSVLAPTLVLATKWVLAPLLALAVLAGCKTTDLQKLADHSGDILTALAPKKLTREQEEQLGRETAATLLGAAPLVRDPEMQRYVNRVGHWIALQTGRSDIAWRFGVLDTPNVNAFAAPAGYVLITRGLLARLNDEAELAGVLAHEVGHVVERHHAEAMAGKDRAGALASLATDLAAPKNQKVASGLSNLAKGVYSAGLDKKDEYAADRLGVLYATRAGYHPYGLPRVLQMYAGAAGESGFELLFSTHPSPQERLDHLELAMDGRVAAFEASGVSDTATFRRVVASARR